MNNLIILVLILISVGWIVWYLLTEKIFVIDNQILKKHRGHTQRLNLTELKEIKYHYHAVVGFVSVWEFIDYNENSILVDGNAKNIDRALSRLESILPEFTLSSFKKRFEAGDVVDTIEVWENA